MNVVLVCGGRDYQDWETVKDTLDAEYQRKPITLIVHGAARGADKLAARWALRKGVHAAAVAALWAFYGYAAGPYRNRAMLKLKPDVVYAFPGGKGTANMVQQARDAGIPVVEVT